jgi:hypothetical protein
VERRNQLTVNESRGVKSGDVHLRQPKVNWHGSAVPNPHVTHVQTEHLYKWKCKHCRLQSIAERASKLVSLSVMSLITFAGVKHKHPNDCLTINLPQCRRWLQDEVGEEHLQKLAFAFSQNLKTFDHMISVKFMQSTCRSKSDNCYPQYATHFKRRRPTMVTDLTEVIRSNALIAFELIS